MFYSFDKTMLIAALLLVTVMLMTSIVFPPQFFEFSFSQRLLGFFLRVVEIVFILFLIRHIRGNEFKIKVDSNRPEKLSIWSYFWRAAVVHGIATLSFAIARLLFVGVQVEIPSVPEAVLIAVLISLLSIFYVWLMFSKDRRGQLVWLMQLVR
ncbi:MAG: hypothetical protein ACI9SP_004297 [Arenicella sp.]|jgi:hypothetical protein